MASATAVKAVGELDKRKALTCNAADTVGTIFVDDTRVINCTPAMTVIFRKQWPNVQVTPTTAAAVARLKRNYFECRTRILGNVPTRVGKRDQVDGQKSLVASYSATSSTSTDMKFEGIKL